MKKKKTDASAEESSSVEEHSTNAHHSYNPTDDQIRSEAYAPITAAVKQRTSVRLLETLQFVLDIMGCPMPKTRDGVAIDDDASLKKDEKDSPFGNGKSPELKLDESFRIGPECMKPIQGEGWRSTVRVRLLHGIVRRRVMSTVKKDGPPTEAEKSKGYDFESGTWFAVCDSRIFMLTENFNPDGYPLNAEDMLLTLLSFCVAPLWACQRIGSPVPAHLESAYIAHWRHVGYYLGVPSDILATSMQVDLNPSQSDMGNHIKTPNKMFASCITHLFAHPRDFQDTTRLPPPALPLLHTIADMPPFQTPINGHFRNARFFLGDSLATALNIPRTSAWHVFLLKKYMLGVTIPEWFGKYYPRKAWDEQRQIYSRELLGRMVRAKLDGRRSMFRPHQTVRGSAPSKNVSTAAAEGDDDNSDHSGDSIKQEPDLPPEVIEMEKEGVYLDRRAGMKTYRAYKLLMVEMVAVCVGIGVVGAWGAFKTVTFALHAAWP